MHQFIKTIYIHNTQSQLQTYITLLAMKILLMIITFDHNRLL